MLSRAARLASIGQRTLPAESSAIAQRAFSASASARKASSPAAAQATASSSKGSAADVAKGATVSSCRPGTALSGLNIYKDRADPVARPDADYPAWLWTLLEEGKTSADGVVLESTEGMSKGQARVAEKRNLRLIRAAHRAKERQAKTEASGSGAGMHAVGQASQGVVGAAAGHAEAAVADAAAVMVDSSAAEREKKRELRVANRASIKARNFVKSQ